MGIAIKIDANTAELHKSMDQAKADLAGFKASLEKATDTQTISKLNKQIKETETYLKGIKNVGFDSNEIKNGSDKAGYALMNLGRVAQDAPFGFIAIQNNLDPLLQSFKSLATESGGVKGALQALGQSLMGGAGLALAFNLVVSAITVFSQHMGKSTAAVDEAKKKFDDYVKTLKDVNSINDEATGSQTGQIAVVKALGAIVQDTNKSYTERKRALNELKEVNKSYFGDLKLEADQMPKLSRAIDEYSQAIIANAKVKGLADEISRQNVEFLKQDRVLTGLKTKYDQAKTAVAGYTGAKDLLVDGEAVASTEWSNLQKQLKDSEQAYTAQRSKVEELGVAMALLNGDVAAAVGQQNQYKDTTSAATKKVDELAKRIAALKEIQGTVGLDFSQKVELTQLEAQITNRDAIKLGFKPEEAKEQIQYKINEVFPNELVEVRTGLNVAIIPEAVKVQGSENLSHILLNDIQRATGSFYAFEPPPIVVKPPKSIKFDPFAEAFGQAFTDSIALIGENIGKAIDDGDFFGGLKAAVTGIFNILGDTLISIGKQLIATSALVKALKAALNGIFGPGGTAVSLAVGIGLISFGSLLKNMPKMADGGVVSSATIATVGEAGTEVVAPLSKLPYLMNQAGGGNGNQTVGLRIKGRELIAFIEREQLYANRLR